MKDQKISRTKISTSFPYPGANEWREAAEKLLKGKPFGKVLQTPTYEGIRLDPIYNRENVKINISGQPGFPPFTRANEPGGQLQKKRLITQEIPETDPAKLNKILRHDLNHGQTAVFIRPLEGYRQNGTNIRSKKEFATILQDIDLEKIPLFLGTNTSGPIYFSWLREYLLEQKINPATLNGSLNYDPLSVLSQTGELERSQAEHFEEMRELIEWAGKNTPYFRIIGVNGSIFADAGANAVQEIAFSMAMAVEYLREMINRGIHIDVAAAQIQFNLSAGANFFMEIAKFRTARPVWQNIVRAFGGNEEVQKMKIHARTTTLNKTKYDPYVNMLRTTTEAFSAIAGTVDSLHVGFFDEQHRQPDEFSRRIARNQQIIIDEEVHLNAVIDPAGGSWYIEYLTSTLSEEIWKEFQIIEEKGGYLSALKKTFIQSEIAGVWKQRETNIARRKDAVIGTNMYPNLSEIDLTNKNNDKPGAAGQKNGKNTNKDGLKITPLPTLRTTQAFEYLREKMDSFKKGGKKAPKIMLINYGSVHEYKARADFARGYVEVAGFEVIYSPGFKTVQEAADAVCRTATPIYILCSSDENYENMADELGKKLKSNLTTSLLLLAGRPGKKETALKSAGFDDFIYMGKDVRENLETLLKHTGVIK